MMKETPLTRGVLERMLLPERKVIETEEEPKLVVEIAPSAASRPQHWREQARQRSRRWVGWMG